MGAVCERRDGSAWIAVGSKFFYCNHICVDLYPDTAQAVVLRRCFDFALRKTMSATLGVRTERSMVRDLLTELHDQT
jgi:hypothetical protein